MQILITWTVGQRRTSETKFRMLHSVDPKVAAFPVEKLGMSMLNEERWESVHLQAADIERIRIRATVALAHHALQVLNPEYLVTGTVGVTDRNVVIDLGHVEL